MEGWKVISSKAETAESAKQEIRMQKEGGEGERENPRQPEWDTGEAQAKSVNKASLTGDKALLEPILFPDSCTPMTLPFWEISLMPWIIATSLPIIRTLVWMGFCALKPREPGAQWMLKKWFPFYLITFLGFLLTQGGNSFLEANDSQNII